MRRRIALTIALSCIALAWCTCALALDPSLDISQYAHTSWKIRDGFTKGAIYAIAQTPDGYLWLGTEFGLLRFDGVRNIRWEPPAGEDLPSTNIQSLLTARDGTLWIGTVDGLASWKDSKLTQYLELAGQVVAALLEDREGTVWAAEYANPTGRICAIQSRDKIQCHGADGSFGRGASSLYEDSGGNLWVGTQTGLWRWKPGPPKHYPMSGFASGIADLIEGDNDTLLIATSSGVRQLVDGKAQAYAVPGFALQFTPDRLLRDRDGGLWIGTQDRGLLHVHGGRTDVFAQSDGLSGNSIRKLFADREGDVWVGTLDGLDRFRDLAVPTISVNQGLSNTSVWSVLAASDGSLWLGTGDGLNRWKGGQITTYRKRSGLPDDAVGSLFQDDQDRIWISTRRGVAYFHDGRFIPITTVPGGLVLSMSGDSAGNIWISDADNGLVHLLRGTEVERIPWANLGQKGPAMALVADSSRGALWLGFFQGGVAYFKDGEVRSSYAIGDGLGKGQVAGLHLDSNGALWAATQGGLSRVKDGRVATLSSKNGLPCDAVHGVMEDDDHSFWLYMDCGLVRTARPDLEAWAADPKRAIQVTVFDSSDGVRGHATTSSYSPRVAKSTDGKLWFLPWDGVSVIDPRHLAFNKIPPPVHVEQVIADRTTYDAAPASGEKLRLPPRVRDVEIDYTALSLVEPEKVLFRYKLEGLENYWHEAGNRRQAFFTDLPPRHYRFRVMASNNSGVWNEAGTSLDFSVLPAFYQTWWFRGLCVAGFVALLWGLYELRVHRLEQLFAAGLEARVNERTRIARDLHDTMLQTFQACLFQMQAARNQLSRQPEKVGPTLDEAIETASSAITEGREAVQGLRSSTVIANDLARAFTTLGEELATKQDSHNPVAFHVEVEGGTRDLHPILRDEVYRIACEAVRNAFQHSGATRIEVGIHYDDRQFRVRVRDNGKGIDPKVLGSGAREGHYGLPGMRERVKLVGGNFTVRSELNSGTEIELTIPASLAYAKSSLARDAASSKKSA